MGGGAPPGAGGLAARSAALRPYVGQLAASEPEERLTEAACQPVARTSGSCGERQGFHVRTSTGARWDGSIFRLTDHAIEHKLLLIVNSLQINAKSSDFTLIENN